MLALGWCFPSFLPIPLGPLVHEMLLPEQVSPELISGNAHTHANKNPKKKSHPFVLTAQHLFSVYIILLLTCIALVCASGSGADGLSLRTDADNPGLVINIIQG